MLATSMTLGAADWGSGCGIIHLPPLRTVKCLGRRAVKHTGREGEGRRAGRESYRAEMRGIAGGALPPPYPPPSYGGGNESQLSLEQSRAVIFFSAAYLAAVSLTS